MLFVKYTIHSNINNSFILRKKYANWLNHYIMYLGFRYKLSKE